MIKNKQKTINRIHVVLDTLMILLAYFSAYFFKFIILGDPMANNMTPKSMEAIKYYAKPLPIVVVGYLLIYAFFRLYTSKRVMGKRRELSMVVISNALGLMIFTTVLYLIKTKYFFSIQMLVYYGAACTIYTCVERMLIKLLLSVLRKRGYNQKHVLLIGCSHSAESFAEKVRENRHWGYEIYGILDDKRALQSEYAGIPIVGRLKQIAEFLDEHQFDEIMITLPLNQYDRLKEVVAATEKAGIHAKFIPDYSDLIPSSPYTEDLLGLPVINIRHVPLMDGPNKFIKRAMDIIGGVLCLIVFSIPMIVCAVLVKCSSKGPILFKQERVGLHNQPFTMYKFRSMTVQTDEEEKDKWTTKNDARVTKIGAIMRKTSMDELPQILNVIKGDMSLIGPRPERPFFVEKFKEEIPRYMVKHQVRPGMTGWAQVNGFRGDTSIRKRIDCDLYYIENWTLGLDFKILILTVFKGFVNKNAY